MVDSAINWLFVDLNSYFASIEQELCPELRDQPIAILPIRVEAQTGCCTAVSYQAKAYGVKTGFTVADAKVLCPHIILVRLAPAYTSNTTTALRPQLSAASPSSRSCPVTSSPASSSAASARCYAPPP
jgi:nucleotidyltransferase/DNA polymerase involved in DNA repair